MNPTYWPPTAVLVIRGQYRVRRTVMAHSTRHLKRNVVGYRVVVRDAEGVTKFTQDVRKRSVDGRKLIFGEKAMSAAFHLADRLLEDTYHRSAGYSSTVEEIRE